MAFPAYAVRRGIPFPVPFQELRGQVPDVIPPVAAVGKFFRLAQKFPVTQKNRFTKVVHLVSRIVDIILPENPITDGRKDVRDDISHHGAPGVTDVERPRRVGADELHLDLPAFSQLRRTVAVPLPDDLFEVTDQDPFPDEKIHESGTGDLHPLKDSLGIIDLLRKDPGDLAGIPPDLRGDYHRHVGCVVPAAGLFRQLPLDERRRRLRQKPRRDARPNRLIKKCNQLPFHRWPSLHMKKVGRKANPLPS